MTETGPVSGDRIGKYDLTQRDILEGRWLGDEFGLEIAFIGGDIVPTVTGGELQPRVTRGEPNVVTLTAIDEGIVGHRVREDHDDPGTYIHEYRAPDGERWHATLTYRWRPEASQYGSVEFYLDDPTPA